MPVGSEIILIYHRSHIRRSLRQRCPLVQNADFPLSDCKETINSADDESVKQVFDRLDEHIAKCPLATFTFEGTTDVARQRADNLRSVIKRLADKLRPH